MRWGREPEVTTSLSSCSTSILDWEQQNSRFAHKPVMRNVILTTVLTMMELRRTWAWEASCEGEKSLSSQKPQMFKVLLIHIQTIFPPPNNCFPVREGISRVTKGGVTRSRIISKIKPKPNCWGLLFVPGKSCLLLLSTERSCLKPRVCTCLQGMWKRGREREQLPASQGEAFVPLWLTAGTFGHVRENSREHYLLGSRTAVPPCEGSWIRWTPPKKQWKH